MKSYRLAAIAGLVLGGTLFMGQSPAHAFRYLTNIADGADEPTGDIILESVTILDDEGNAVETISDFTLVTDVNIVSNDVYEGENTGAASVDVGDTATGTASEDPTDEEIADVLENTNLNNIIDTEDGGNFAIDVFFEEAVDNLFVWERGMNSDIRIQGLDASGQLTGVSFLIERGFWEDAGYAINTTEIDPNAQQVGSFGISMADLGLTGSISGFRLSSDEDFNGPDWKILGSVVDRPAPKETPEPTAMAGLGLIAGAVVVSRRKRQAAEA